MYSTGIVVVGSNPRNVGRARIHLDEYIDEGYLSIVSLGISLS